MTTKQRTCSHIKADGKICAAVALASKDFCYFHHRDRKRQAEILQALNHRRTSLSQNQRQAVYRYIPNRESLFDDASAALFASLDLPPVEDQASVLVNITSIMRALATQQIEPRVGALLLYALQIASTHINSKSQSIAAQQEAPHDPAV